MANSDPDDHETFVRVLADYRAAELAGELGPRLMPATAADLVERDEAY